MKNRRNNQGFTLVELIVSSAVIIIVFSYVLANFRGAGQANLQLAVQKTVNDIREAQTMGLSGKIFNGVVPAVSPVGGYGIKISQCTSDCSYDLFADLNGNVDKDANETIGSFTRSMPGKNFIEKICYSVEAVPIMPPCTNVPAWQSLSEGISYFTVTFQTDKNSIKVVTQPVSPAEEVRHIGIIVKNEKTNDQYYIYIARDTGLISSDLLP